MYRDEIKAVINAISDAVKKLYYYKEKITFAVDVSKNALDDLRRKARGLQTRAAQIEQVKQKIEHGLLKEPIMKSPGDSNRLQLERKPSAPKAPSSRDKERVQIDLEIIGEKILYDVLGTALKKQLFQLLRGRGSAKAWGKFFGKLVIELGSKGWPAGIIWKLISAIKRAIKGALKSATVDFERLGKIAVDCLNKEVEKLLKTMGVKLTSQAKRNLKRALADPEARKVVRSHLNKAMTDKIFPKMSELNAASQVLFNLAHKMNIKRLMTE
jgi:hypothetical protein